jgi:hypothetical protein
MQSKIDKAIEVLKQQGHTVRPYNREGTFWFEIDGRMLASAQEMGELADRVYSLTELDDLFKKRRAEEQRIN